MKRHKSNVQKVAAELVEFNQEIRRDHSSDPPFGEERQAGRKAGDGRTGWGCGCQH
jgi:hypothetical protein